MIVDREKAGLLGGKPNWKGASKMLNQDSGKAFQGPKGAR